MARLSDGPALRDAWLGWAVGLWRGTVPCLILLSGVALWNWNDPSLALNNLDNGGDDLELAVVDAIDLSDNLDE